MSRIIYIDWISPPEHANFNRAFFSAIRTKDVELVVFSGKLVLETVDCRLVNDSGNRVSRALHVFRICAKWRRARIIFLTFDPLFLPLLSLMKIPLAVFEHNTTPDALPFNKHAIWQSLFMRRINRFAQYPGQYNRLKELKQKCFYIGSPLLKCKKKPSGRNDVGYYVLASYRISFEQVRVVSPFLRGAEIAVKSKVLRSQGIPVDVGATFRPVDFIDLDEPNSQILGIIVTVQSRIRGSGWFNDAISRGIPIIITNADAATLFEETFPRFPYVNMVECVDQQSFDSKLRICASFVPDACIRMHNDNLRARFTQSLKSIRWQ